MVVVADEEDVAPLDLRVPPDQILEQIGVLASRIVPLAQAA